ncbi:FimV/HubP family polar landmark protein [Shewanella ulleungensis]|uniref:FimV/HubP family polar landmark protein n=1 Tax=Shewanella ulleungensis TaxID=2282699 RepID=UPI003D7A7F53
MKGVKVLAIMALLAVGYNPTVIAEVSHISIDTAAFEQGQLPRLTVNVVTEHHDLSRLTFYLRQIYQDNIVLEKLDVERQGNDVFTLSGKEQLRDPDSALIVSEYRNAKWQQYSPVPLFNQLSQTSSHQPVAIKKMKLPTSLSSSAPQVAEITRVVAKTPVLAATQELLEGCNILKQPNDSLWKIAVRYRKQWGSNIYGAMLALYEANPQAFYQGKISLLQLDSSLRCPSANILVKYQNVDADRATFDDLVASQQGQTSAIAQASKRAVPKKAPQPIHVNAIAVSVDHTKIDADVTTGNRIDITDVTDVVKVDALEHQSVQQCSIDKRPDDNLWRVAVRNHQQLNTNVYGAMLALYHANPNAFFKQRIYLLMADSSLDCPSNKALQQYQNAAKDQLTYEALERKQRRS